MGGSSVSEPKPTSQEIAIQQEQLELMRVERARMDAATPLFQKQLELAEKTLDQQRRQLEALERANASGLADEQIALQREQIAIAREGLKQQQEATQQQRALEPFVLKGLGLAREGDTFRRLTEDEIVAGMTEQEKIAHENMTLALEREGKALRGELPLSEGMQQAKAEEFRLFKEAMARAGNPIEGDTPESATASTTAGIQSLRQFQQRFGMLEEAERRGELTAGTTALLQRMGVTSDIGAQRTAGLLALPASTAGFGVGGGVGPSGFAIPGVAGVGMPGVRSPGEIAGGFSGLLEPLEAQRALGFQARQATAQNRRQTSGLIGGAGGALAGAAAGAMIGSAFMGVGAVPGAMLGAALGGTAGTAGGTLIGSSRTIKKDIKRATRREEDRALKMVKGLDVKTYRYRNEAKTEPKRLGLIAEEAPREIATPDRRGLDVGRTLGLLTAATRALARQVEKGA